VKKELAERWKRGAETNAEGVRIEAPRGREMGRGCPLPNRLGCLGERRELPSGVQGGAPAENEFGAFCGRSKDADSNYLLNFCFIKHSSIAFRLERLHKFRYGVPPFQKVPVWRSGAFRLSLSTGNHYL